MFKLVVLSACLVAALAAPRIDTDLPQLDGRIVGGDDADISEYPYQLSLEIYGSHSCGASLISENFAVTAAHCTDGRTASSLKVRAGSSKKGRDGQLIAVAEILQHPQYNRANIDYDVSVLKLATSVKLGKAVQAIKLIDTTVDLGTMATVTGWGAVREGGGLPDQLKAVQVPIISIDICKKDYRDSAITARMICAGFIDGEKDSCQGDSGGPLAADGQLVGIVSWGYGCARPKKPGVYTSVAAVKQFIMQNSDLE